MVNQKSVHLKLHWKTLDDLDYRLEGTPMSRNEAINRAVRLWLELDKLEKYYRMYRTMGETATGWRNMQAPYVHGELAWLFDDVMNR